MPVTVRHEPSAGARRIAVAVAGDPEHPTTAGTLCTKVARYLERTYHPDRLLTPLKRVGPKGSRRFERTSWDQALGDIARRLGRIAARGPQGIVPYSYAGTMGLVTADGRNANELTHQRLTDLGRPAAFYDCLVQVCRSADVGGAA